ncbi:MAG: choloylglycine hydrolase [Clostridia bacterium]|nr:choloylglycine hydrolase [Clostridia bacterium]
MCTTLCLNSVYPYFGRTLDLYYSHDETVTVVSGEFPFSFRNGMSLCSHPKIMGMTYVKDGYPLFYDAMNSHGLGIAALNFPHNAKYNKKKQGFLNLAPFEIIPYILSTCETLDDAKKLFEKVNITDDVFSPELPNTPLHWMVSDGEFSFIVEQTEDGMKIFENNVGIMTNAPSFNYHLVHLQDYSFISPYAKKSWLPDSVSHFPYTLGLESKGIPGDWSSSSRFVRGAYIRSVTPEVKDENESIGHFFHILSQVSVPKGCVVTEKGEFQMTRYTSCMNLHRGIYYYTTYDNQRITAVSMNGDDSENKNIICFPLRKNQDIYYDYKR